MRTAISASLIWIICQGLFGSFCNKPQEKQCDNKKEDSIAILHKQVRDRDSMLYLWLNDYTYRLRVMSGLEKDPQVLKYETWRHRNKIQK